MTDEPVERANPDFLPRWEMIAVLVGDLLAMLIFASIGRGSHGRLDGAGIRGILDTAVPFMVSWLIASAILGTYSGKAFYPLRRVAGRTALAGVTGGLLGVVLWSLYRGRWTAWTFFPVASLSSTAILLVWRVAWSRFRRLWWTELP